LDDVALRPPRLDEVFLTLTGQAPPEDSTRFAADPGTSSPNGSRIGEEADRV
jgi:hypothetical protein